jgi:exopolyphosphatase/guanosine-5'-triphosphate,3'-diphosphate pyrophosphatase
VDDAVKEPTRHLLNERAAEEVRTLGLALRLAYTLCGGTIDLLFETRLYLEANNLILEIPSSGSLFLGEAVQRRLEALGRSIGISPTVRRRERTETARG